MRGEDANGTRACFNSTWIIPACAGKTWTPFLPLGVAPDHPRMRGEDPKAAFTSDAPVGSPPHARGRLHLNSRRIVVQGITPACAGKTSSRASNAPPRRDHPRMRGEDGVPFEKYARYWGSPPHARGRLAGLRGHDRKVGITPACAGKTRF